jgi:hypothetical protein
MLLPENSIREIAELQSLLLNYTATETKTRKKHLVR